MFDLSYSCDLFDLFRVSYFVCGVYRWLIFVMRWLVLFLLIIYFLCFGMALFLLLVL